MHVKYLAKAINKNKMKKYLLKNLPAFDLEKLTMIKRNINTKYVVNELVLFILSFIIIMSLLLLISQELW